MAQGSAVAKNVSVEPRSMRASYGMINLGKTDWSSGLKVEHFW